MVLRNKRLDDAWDDYCWRRDEELARLDAADPLNMPFPEYLQYYREDMRHSTPWSRRFAIETPDGRHIGNCMCYDINGLTREAEIGIMIGLREFWDHGYGYDAVVTLTEYCFSAIPLDRLYLHTLDWNIRAQKCFLKCGYQKVKAVRRQRKSFLLMELTRSRWEEIRNEKLGLAEPAASSAPND